MTRLHLFITIWLFVRVYMCALLHILWEPAAVSGRSGTKWMAAVEILIDMKIEMKYKKNDNAKKRKWIRDENKY